MSLGSLTSTIIPPKSTPALLIDTGRRVVIKKSCFDIPGPSSPHESLSNNINNTTASLFKNAVSKISSFFSFASSSQNKFNASHVSSTKALSKVIRMAIDGNNSNTHHHHHKLRKASYKKGCDEHDDYERGKKLQKNEDRILRQNALELAVRTIKAKGLPAAEMAIKELGKGSWSGDKSFKRHMRVLEELYAEGGVDFEEAVLSSNLLVEIGKVSLKGEICDMFFIAHIFNLRDLYSLCSENTQGG